MEISGVRQAPLLPWTVRDRLLLCDLVQKYGNQSWQCATQYNSIIEKVVTPRRQRRNDASVENPEIKIARELREQRMLELKRLLEEDQQVYRQITMDMIRADAASKKDLQSMLSELEEWKSRQEEHEARISKLHRARRSSHRSSRSQPGSPSSMSPKQSTSGSATSTPLRTPAASRSSAGSTPLARVESALVEGQASLTSTEEQMASPRASPHSLLDLSSDAINGAERMVAESDQRANESSLDQPDVTSMSSNVETTMYASVDEKKKTLDDSKAHTEVESSVVADQEEPSLSADTLQKQTVSQKEDKSIDTREEKQELVNSTSKDPQYSENVKMQEKTRLKVVNTEPIPKKQEEDILPQESVDQQQMAEKDKGIKEEEILTDAAERQQSNIIYPSNSSSLPVAPKQAAKDPQLPKERSAHCQHDQEALDSNLQILQKSTKASNPISDDSAIPSTKLTTEMKTVSNIEFVPSVENSESKREETDNDTSSGQTVVEAHLSHNSSIDDAETRKPHGRKSQSSSRPPSRETPAIEEPSSPSGSVNSEATTPVYKEEPSEPNSPMTEFDITPTQQQRRHNLRTRTSSRRKTKMNQVTGGELSSFAHGWNSIPSKDDTIASSPSGKFNAEALDDDAPLVLSGPSRRHRSQRKANDLPKTLFGHNLELITPVTHEFKELWELEDLAPDELEEKQRTWRTSIMTVWRQIAGHKDANLFRHPVKEDHAPGYYDVIKRPSDLSTIEHKIKIKEITTTQEFEHSIMQMLANASMFNTEDHPVHMAAQEMRQDAINAIENFKHARLAAISEDSDRPIRGGRRKKTETDEEDEDGPTPKRTRSKSRS